MYSDRAIDAWQNHAALYLAIRQVSVARDITDVQSDGAIAAWQSHAVLYLAIRQVSVARDITELLIAKLADAALQLETCEGACHTPEPDVPCACSKRIRGISLNYGMRPCKTQQSRLCKELVCLRLAVHRQEHQKDAVVLRQHLKRT